RVFGFTWPITGLSNDDPRHTDVEFTLEPVSSGTRLTVVESGFAQLPDDIHRKAYEGNVEGWTQGLAELVQYPMPAPESADIEAIASRSSSQWPIRPDAASWPQGRRTGRPPRRTWRLDCQSRGRRSLSTSRCNRGAGLVTAAPGERRRVRYRLCPGPIQVAQQFPAALARDWDNRLGALKYHLDH